MGEELSTHPYLNSESQLLWIAKESPVRTLSEVFGVVWKDNYAPRTVKSNSTWRASSSVSPGLPMRRGAASGG